MRELSDVMNGAVDARVRALDTTPATDEVLSGLRARVRRRRAVRRAVQVLSVAPVVAAVATVGWFGLREPAPSPAVPATVSPTPTTTQTPPATPTADPVAEPVVEPGLPPYLPARADTVASTGRGWVLATYAPRLLDADTVPLAAPVTESFFLVGPDGTTYRTLALDTAATQVADGTTWVEHEVVHWSVGDATALVRTVDVLGTRDSENRAPRAFEVLDLSTGTLSPAPERIPPTHRFLGEAPDGRLLWAEGAQGGSTTLVVTDGAETEEIDTGVELLQVALSPDGTTALVGWGYGSDAVVLDLDRSAVVGTVPRSGDSGWCEPFGWSTARRLLASCSSVDPGTDPGLLDGDPRLMSLDVADLGSGRWTEVRALGADDVVARGWGATVGDGLVVAAGTELADNPSGAYACPTGVYLIGPDADERLPASDLHPELGTNLFTPVVVDGTVFVTSTGGCSGDATPATLSSFVPATGSFHELVGPPPTPGYAGGLVSYAVAR